MTIALAGCSTTQYTEWADRDSYGTIKEGQDSVLGENSEFDIEYKPVDCREFLQKVQSQIEGDEDTPVMTLENALKIAFQNSRDFQTKKENLYSSALSLANLSRGWTTLLFNGNADATGEVARTQKGQTYKYIEGNTGASLTKRLVGGGLLTLGASLNFVTNLVGGSDTEIGSLVHGTFTQPLLQGAWRDLAYEEQYRRERNFLFDVFEFSRYRQTFAVGIMQDYYNVLRNRDQIENSRTSIMRLQKAYDMTRTLVEGGQVSKVQEDQAEQDLLNAQIALESTLLTYSYALDSFKITLGLPISTEMRLDYPNALNLLNKQGPKPFPFTETEAVNISLSTDTKLMRTRASMRDRDRDVEIAADKFNPGLDLELGIDTPGTSPHDPQRIQTHHQTRNAKLKFRYDLDQTNNRDNYRNAMIERDRAVRDMEKEEDKATLSILNSSRSLKQSKQSFLLQEKSVKIANRRTTLVAIQRNEGQASARDVLEAERSRIIALNGLTNSLINYTMTRLDFLADLGMLDVDNQGLITEREQPFGFDRLQKLYAYLSPGQTIVDARTNITNTNIEPQPKENTEAQEDEKTNE